MRTEEASVGNYWPCNTHPCSDFERSTFLTASEEKLVYSSENYQWPCPVCSDHFNRCECEWSGLPIFPSVCPGMAQCKASREMLRVEGLLQVLHSANCDETDCTFAWPWHLRPPASCQRAFRDEEGKELHTVSLSRLSVHPLRPAFRPGLLIVSLGEVVVAPAVGKVESGRMCVMWIRPHTQLHAFTLTYKHCKPMARKKKEIDHHSCN